MPTEHRRPTGNLSPGYFCSNCGEPVGLMGHIRDWWKDCSEYWCTPNPKLVERLRAANPSEGHKPRYIVPGVIRE